LAAAVLQSRSCYQSDYNIKQLKKQYLQHLSVAGSKFIIREGQIRRCKFSLFRFDMLIEYRFPMAIAYMVWVRVYRIFSVV